MSTGDLTPDQLVADPAMVRLLDSWNASRERLKTLVRSGYDDAVFAALALQRDGAIALACYLLIGDADDRRMAVTLLGWMDDPLALELLGQAHQWERLNYHSNWLEAPNVVEDVMIAAVRRAMRATTDEQRLLAIGVLGAIATSNIAWGCRGQTLAHLDRLTDGRHPALRLADQPNITVPSNPSIPKIEVEINTAPADAVELAGTLGTAAAAVPASETRRQHDRLREAWLPAPVHVAFRVMGFVAVLALFVSPVILIMMLSGALAHSLVVCGWLLVAVSARTYVTTIIPRNRFRQMLKLRTRLDQLHADSSEFRATHERLEALASMVGDRSEAAQRRTERDRPVTIGAVVTAVLVHMLGPAFMGFAAWVATLGAIGFTIYVARGNTLTPIYPEGHPGNVGWNVVAPADS